MENNRDPGNAVTPRGRPCRLRLNLSPFRGLSQQPVFRLSAFTLFAALWFAVVLLRLWDLQIRQGPRLAERAQKQHEGVIEIQAARGAILDRFGEELALSTPVDSIGVILPKVKDPDLTASLVAEVLRVDRRAVAEKLSRSRFQWIKRLAEPGEAERVRQLKLPGIHFEKESKRYYPKGPVASHILGAVGIDHVGLAGLEQSYEELLRGRTGRRLVQHDGLQNRYASQTLVEPTPGVSLVLTIDERIQMMAEKELARAIHETQSAAGTILVMDPKNGDLLALANWPTFDPNKRVTTTAELERRRNFAISNLIEPGSTFKIVTVAAAIEEGLTKPTEVLYCEEGGILLGSRYIRDHKEFGNLTVAEVLAFSSNVGTIKLGLRLQPERLYEYAKRFGFGRATGIPLPGEIDGILRPPEGWQSTSLASIAIGQEVGVTALQVARAAAAIANGGLLVQPRVIQAMIHPDGRREETQIPPALRILRPESAATVRAMMELSVREGTSQLAQTPGYRAAGKTGTAQKVDPETGAYSQTDYVSSFVGFAPVNDPRILVMIVLDSPVGKYYGGQVAAPVFPRVAVQALRFLDVPGELPVAPEKALPEFRLAQAPEGALADFHKDASRGESLLAPASFQREAGGGVVVAVGHTAAAPQRSEARELQAAHSRTPVKLRVVQRALPDFRGRTVRQVAAQATALGLRLEMRGSGAARKQWPPPGAPVTRGQTVTVEFARSLEGTESP